MKGVCSDISFSFLSFQLFYRFYNTIGIDRNEKGALQNFTFGWFSIASKPHFPNKSKSPLNQGLKGIFFY
jgi:hypothetical protein